MSQASRTWSRASTSRSLSCVQHDAAPAQPAAVQVVALVASCDHEREPGDEQQRRHERVVVGELEDEQHRRDGGARGGAHDAAHRHEGPGRGGDLQRREQPGERARDGAAGGGAHIQRRGEQAARAAGAQRERRGDDLGEEQPEDDPPGGALEELRGNGQVPGAEQEATGEVDQQAHSAAAEGRAHPAVRRTTSARRAPMPKYVRTNSTVTRPQATPSSGGSASSSNHERDGCSTGMGKAGCTPKTACDTTAAVTLLTTTVGKAATCSPPQELLEREEGARQRRVEGRRDARRRAGGHQQAGAIAREAERPGEERAQAAAHHRGRSLTAHGSAGHPA